MNFEIKTSLRPAGDQEQAIAKLTDGVNSGLRTQVLLGATGTGKTYTIAQVIARTQRPTLVIAHNKTLAAQLASEFKSFFPNNAVEYFVSYYDYYQPEAYIPQSDTYIDKDAAINDEIDKLRHSATSALFERRDVVVVASVSCIYGLGAPMEYFNMVLSLRQGMTVDRQEILRRLVSMQYERNNLELKRGSFRVRGDIIEVVPAGFGEKVVRIELFDDEVERILEAELTSGKVVAQRTHVAIFPASHYVTSEDNMQRAMRGIRLELEDRLQWLHTHNKLLEEQRLAQRTQYDLEMMEEMGYCSGIENYSRHLDGRSAGEAPFTLMDYFSGDWLVVIDESHVTLPQIRAMYAGDRARKTMLVDYGFRLPSAFDNRPLTFDEFQAKVKQVIYVSATPAAYELTEAEQVVEQIIRPTGLLDPKIEVRPIGGQIDDLIGQINLTVERHERVLVTTLTKRMAEDLTRYLQEAGIRVRYMHSDIATIERGDIIDGLRCGEFDVLVGINLLREGLDLPEVSLVAILDADKEGFLRSDTAMIQTIGRAARNANGMVIMYADRITDSMSRAINETERRRRIQDAYNKAHHITPQTVHKEQRPLIKLTKVEELVSSAADWSYVKVEQLTAKELKQLVLKLKREMRKAIKEMNFEKAAELRDRLQSIEKTRC